MLRIERNTRDDLQANGVFDELRNAGRVRHAAPALGQHTDDVLAQAGLSPERIAALRKDGVIE